MLAADAVDAFLAAADEIAPLPEADDDVLDVVLLEVDDEFEDAFAEEELELVSGTAGLLIFTLVFGLLYFT